MNSTRSNWKRPAASLATARCASCTGSNVPPKIASFTRWPVVNERPALYPLDLDRVDPNFFHRTILRAARDFGNLLHHVVAFHHFPEDRMAIVEPVSGSDRDEELAAVAVGTGIRHGKDSRLGVLQVGMEFVCE